MNELHFGRVDDQTVMENVLQSFETPVFQTGQYDPNLDMLLHLEFKRIVGHFCNHEPNQHSVQRIGDCVDWGTVRNLDYQQVMDQVFDTTPNQVLEYQKAAKSVVYAGSRVQIGKGQLGRGDGSIGIWAFKFLKDYGGISQQELKSLGHNPSYDPQRARDWGVQGVPSDVLPATRRRPVADVTQVRSFAAAAWHIQNGRPVTVCSNVGFMNGPNGLTQRDAKGYAKPRGTWQHCMCFTGVLLSNGRPALVLENQHPHEATVGPHGDFELPPSAWLVDAEVCDNMLSQNDSYTLTAYAGYPVRRLTLAH